MSRWLFVQSRSFHCWEALGIGYLISTLKAAGEKDVEFKSGFFDSDNDIINAAHKADIVGFGCTSPQMAHAIKLASKISTHKIIGGVHPSALPESCLEHFDQVIIGEGENAVLEILRGNTKRTITAPVVKELDLLPFPDRVAIKQWRNIKQAKGDTGERIGSIFSSRGCPFRCKFCASNALWGRTVRFRSGRNIYNEFKQIVKNLNLDFVKFSDDTFTLKRKVVLDFCEAKLRAGDKTPWGANIRANSVDVLLLRFMRLAGCREVWIGVESGSPAILKDVRKGVTVDRIKSCFRVCHTIGIKTRAYVLLGTPLETHKTIRLTESRIDEIKPAEVGFTILAPYPGSTYYDEGKHSHLDFSQVDEYGNDVTESKELSNEELKAEQKRLVEKYKTRAVFRHRKSAGNGRSRKYRGRIYIPAGE